MAGKAQKNRKPDGRVSVTVVSSTYFPGHVAHVKVYPGQRQDARCAAAAMAKRKGWSTGRIDPNKHEKFSLEWEN